MKFFKHIITITRHRHMVMKYCFRCGLIKQGLLHDLSKYSPSELFSSAKYYAGTYSPNTNERRAKGYSEAWLHHKGRNKHHGEYWLDINLNSGKYEPVKMPRRYVVESMCDRIAASKNYNRGHFTPNMPYDYLFQEGHSIIMHEETKRELGYLLSIYRDKGEREAFRYARKVYLKNKV